MKRKGNVLWNSKNHRMACVGRELKDFFQRRRTKVDRVFQRQGKECWVTLTVHIPPTGSAGENKEFRWLSPRQLCYQNTADLLNLTSTELSCIVHTSADTDGHFRQYGLLYVVALHSLEFKEIQSPDCSMLSIFKITNSAKRRCTVYKAELGSIPTQAV